ncbi:MAG: Type A flavoprotein FprA [Candidatus Methanofastidiosum methylothiophilum]|uniref:Type A flavoprotein FprA n=1 Tax=Candidatus Methanofastidiosum methylothiophilum TaxID=1705564 RepID=A0A150JMZ8_9EURY|nr:MAG: Type A flavoprotein FprA [Candidatus Methanofastidiosum methylthiophilus]MBP6932810.1 FprA family A-type flavoprotein [Methanofastidiosum sp.]OQC51866.1 MAG: Type A flavoprotein FprA [Euryarchaeota archaeon ADurb.Bin023]KYC56844.1 MAG: Type A flavoprotein FprA [Candidatus Methanofastidiosum methylthiophilus]KYC58653.1 MAG: Type A flavoprotein FprA [Candidatus Methanofastidiosum methylthiophilus]
MIPKVIKKDIYWTGFIDWDRRLFDSLIPTPNGTTYNSYLIKGSEKTMLIDTSDFGKENDLLNAIEITGVKKIDYVVSNHAEQDHSGSLPKILKKYPDAKIVTNAKCKELIESFLLIPEERFIVISDNQEISLGNKTVQFIIAPWVHWPDTMFSYLKEDKILFSCDFLGSHFATSSLYVPDEREIYLSAKRYYAEIMMPFRSMIRKYLERIGKLDIDIIAPSHGPLYDKPSFIIEAYKDWSSDTVKNQVVIPYVSMHGSTKIMVDYLSETLSNMGVEVKLFNLEIADAGDLLMSLVDAATIVVGAPTMLVGPHPLAYYATYLVNAVRPKTKFVSIVGSFGWGGNAVEILKGMITNIKVELIEPVYIKGYPKEIDFISLDNLANEIVKKHREIGV